MKCLNLSTYNYKEVYALLILLFVIICTKPCLSKVDVYLINI